MNRYVLSPMPGLLVDVAVQVGQKVSGRTREEEVIEAMKWKMCCLRFERRGWQVIKAES
jgi:biotin carboxyl carrier protein